MAAAMPVPRPEGGEPQDGQPRFFWVPGSQDANGVELSGPVPPEAMPGYQPDGLPAGLDWTALIDALAAGGKLGSLDEEPQPEDQQQWRQGDSAGQELTRRQDGRDPGVEAGRLAAVAVEHMVPGPALGGWLEVTGQAAEKLDEDGLTAVAIATRRQAARAQAMHLAAVAQLLARTAAADPEVGLFADGRPAGVTRDGAGQIEMGLNLSHEGARALADLATTLTWRLRRTGAALAEGVIDLDRAKVIAQSTGVLSEELARQVEAQILPRAAGMTTAELRRRLTVLVITADPAGAEQRRKDAEQHADVRLYADDDNTATLIAEKLPQVLAASGYARINALAWARKKDGLPGSIRHHRATILLELIMGTLEFIPPPEGAPPDQPPRPDDDPPPSGGQPPPHTPPAAGPQPDGAQGGIPAPDAGLTGGPYDDLPMPRDEDAPEDDGLNDLGEEPGQDLDPWDPDDLDPASPAPAWPQSGTIPPALARADRRGAGTPPAPRPTRPDDAGRRGSAGSV